MPLGLPRKYLPQEFRMVAGEPPQPLLEFEGVRLAPFLCYEGILADYVRDVAGDARPDMLVSLTNDSWFGDTWEPWQHLNFTRFRAVEHRAPLIRATNTGISAFVSAAGDLEGTLSHDVAGVLVRDVPLVDRDRTLYVRIGYRLPWLFGAWALLAWLVTMVRRPRAWDV
jgi:apolipoprotein N-acyltransferase